MQPGGGNGNGSGFRYGRGQPYRPPVLPEQQMTPQEREAVLMAAGRLAAEYLVNRGDLPPNVLENRPPAAIPSLGVGGQPAFGSQYHHQPPVPRTFYSQFQGRPPAPQHRQPQAWPNPFHFHQGQQRPPAPQRRFPGPRPFQGGRGPFPKRPRQRPFPYGPPGPAPPQTRYAGQAAAPVVAASRNKQDDDNEHSAPAGEAGDSQLTTAQSDVPASGSQQTNDPSSGSLGANASESS